MIEWLQSIYKNKSVDSKLCIYNKQLSFDFLENINEIYKIEITYDSTIPVPGWGGYSLPDGVKFEDAFKKIILMCEIDNLEIERIYKNLKFKLELELEIGKREESKKPKYF